MISIALVHTDVISSGRLKMSKIQCFNVPMRAASATNFFEICCGCVSVESWTMCMFKRHGETTRQSYPVEQGFKGPKHCLEFGQSNRSGLWDTSWCSTSLSSFPGLPRPMKDWVDDSAVNSSQGRQRERWEERWEERERERICASQETNANYGNSVSMCFASFCKKQALHQVERSQVSANNFPKGFPPSLDDPCAVPLGQVLRAHPLALPRVRVRVNCAERASCWLILFQSRW